MDISQTRAFSGLRMVATPTASLVSNDVTIGISSTNTALADVDTGYAARALIVGAASDLVLDLADNDSTGTTAWTAGQAQVETATAAGTVTGSGNATVIVTAAGMTGTPKTISVPVLNGDLAATWAGKVRTALAADTAVAALFTVDGTTTAIRLTRKPTATYTVGTASVPLYAANDATLNISLDNGTSTGITTAATSANTTSGILTAGVYLLDADGKDFEGATLTAIAANRLGGVLISNQSGSAGDILVSTAATLVDFPIQPDGSLQVTAKNCDQSLEILTIEAASTAIVSIVVCGATTA
jgi:hypothetical protein